MTIRSTVKRLALRAGVEVRRFDPLDSVEARLARQLAVNGVDLVLDVGANDGGFGRLVRKGGYEGEILSFEPLAAAHAELTRTAAAHERWHVAPRMALGEEDGTVTVNVAAKSHSSSILPMRPLHADAAPGSRYVGEETAPMRRLDSVDHECLRRATAPFLKIDTQGYEMPVLRGAGALLDRVRGLEVELSVAALYEGQALYRDVIDYLEARGFALWDVSPFFFDPGSRRLLQFDGTFFRD